jgi:hypothetical protein
LRIQEQETHLILNEHDDDDDGGDDDDDDDSFGKHALVTGSKGHHDDRRM